MSDARKNRVNDDDRAYSALFGPESKFVKRVDSLVLEMNSDPKLAEGMRHLDGEAQKQGISLYEMIYRVALKYAADDKAREWLRDKGD
ncbi:MAG: hypothetical protein KGH66_01580 [Candidatus Micrarchaeota archaeon]|nr:hypothetical protein [Candidatus Micrarchaeota archaeon]